MTTWLQHTGSRLLDLAFPSSCVACASEIELGGEEASLCRDCLGKLAMVAWPACRRCAARVPEIPGAVDACFQCKREKLRFDRTLALGSYEGLLRDLVSQMKHDTKEVLAHTFVRFFCDRLGKELRELQADVIVPIPQNFWRRLRRRTNAPATMAELLGNKLGLPVARGLLHLNPNTRPQRGLSQPGRKRNVRGALHVRSGFPLASVHVLLVDDVMTTGATCSEAARVLKRSGVGKVSALVVGRTLLQ